MEDQWIDICRTGTFRDRFGRDVELTEEKFDRMVAQYDPQQREAPAVIGHPTLNSPAYGWVAEMRRKGDRLQAKFRDVVHEFAEGVRKRMWPQRSIKFDAGMNLIHVGFLGAAPPAVPGLAGIEFSSEVEGIEIEYELADWRMPTVSELFRRLRDWILSEKDMETADRIIPPETLTELADRLDEVPEWYRQQMDDHERRLREMEERNDASRATARDSEFSAGVPVIDATHPVSSLRSDPPLEGGENPPRPAQRGTPPRRGLQEPEFSTTMNSTMTTNGSAADAGNAVTTSTAANESRPTQIMDPALYDRVRRLEEENAQLRETASINEFSAFLDSTEMSERVTPAMRDGAIELFRVLRAGPEEFAFASGESTPADFFREWLRKLPKTVELGSDPRLADRDEHELSGDEDVYLQEGDAIARS